MPNIHIRASETDTVRVDAETWSIGTRGVGLRVDYGGTGEMPTQSIITLPEWRAEALDQLLAISPVVNGLPDIQNLYDAVLQDNGAVDMQLSTDGGSTFLYWDGANWSTATITDWTNFTDLNTNLATVPFDTNWTLQIKLRLLRGGATSGPEVYSVRIGYSLIENHEQEDTFRTIKRLLEENVRIEFRETYVATGSNTVDVNHPIPIAEVISVYNLTSDPTRTTDISAGTYDNTGGVRVVDLVSSPTALDVLEVRWKATPNVRISNADTDLNNQLTEHLPLLLLQILGSEEVKEAATSKVGNYTYRNIPLDTYYGEPYPDMLDYRVQIFALAADEILSIKMSNAVYNTVRDLAVDKPRRQIMSGTPYELLDFEPPMANLTDTSEKLSVKSVIFIMYAREWRGPVVSGPLAQIYEVYSDNQLVIDTTP